jgi:hypothetical protein
VVVVVVAVAVVGCEHGCALVSSHCSKLAECLALFISKLLRLNLLLASTA